MNPVDIGERITKLEIQINYVSSQLDDMAADIGELHKTLIDGLAKDIYYPNGLIGKLTGRIERMERIAWLISIVGPVIASVLTAYLVRVVVK